MDKSLDKTLVDALQWANIRELPESDKGENVYILALALVSKKDGSKGYVALKKDDKGQDKIVKDFGSISQIVKIEETYPYLYLDSSYLPDLKKKEDKIKWLSIHDNTKNYEELTIKELNKTILVVAIQNQLRDVKFAK